MQEIYLSREGLEKLKKELFELKTVRRKAVVERIKEAKEFGDLTENSEYEDAKNEQAFIEGRILEIENIIKKAKVISGGAKDRVSIGSKVTVKSDGEKDVFILVGRDEADPLSGKISFDSPIGKALLGKVKGEKLEVETPSGKIKYEIIDIE